VPSDATTIPMNKFVVNFVSEIGFFTHKYHSLLEKNAKTAFTLWNLAFYYQI